MIKTNRLFNELNRFTFTQFGMTTHKFINIKLLYMVENTFFLANFVHQN